MMVLEKIGNYLQDSSDLQPTKHDVQFILSSLPFGQVGGQPGDRVMLNRNTTQKENEIKPSVDL